MESEYRYTPDSERWEGHTYDDDCEPAMQRYQGEPLIGFTVANYFGKRALKDFFAMTDYEPLRVLEPEDTFDGSNYAEGTIIAFQEEYPEHDKIQDVDELADETTYWGVVCGYNNRGGRIKVLMTYQDAEIEDESHIPNPHGTGALVMTVGAIRHLRDVEGYINTISRTNAISIYQHGIGVKQEGRFTQLLRTFKAVTSNS